MKKVYRSTLLLAGILSIAACTTILDKTTSEPITTDPGARTLGTYLNDERLEIIVGVNINKSSPQLKLANVGVTSFNNIILLTGQVPNLELKTLAKDIASKVNMVKNVHNELQIKGNTALLVRTNDTWLSTKVKAAHIADKLVDSSKIKVIVEDGIVYLMGIMTQPEGNYAAEITSKVSGVQEVVKVFEYIQ